MEPDRSSRLLEEILEPMRSAALLIHPPLPGSQSDLLRRLSLVTPIDLPANGCPVNADKIDQLLGFRIILIQPPSVPVDKINVATEPRHLADEVGDPLARGGALKPSLELGGRHQMTQLDQCTVTFSPSSAERIHPAKDRAETQEQHTPPTVKPETKSCLVAGAGIE